MKFWHRAIHIIIAISLVVTMAVVELPQYAYATGHMLMATGSYTGDGTSSHAITGVGFQPDAVIVKGAISKSAYIRTSTMGANESKSAADDAVLQTNMILSFQSDGFTVGSDDAVNKSGGVTYYWTAFKAAAGELNIGSYAGNGADNRSITGVGFQPDYVIVMSADSRKPVHRSSSMSGDVSLMFDIGTGNNMIQVLEADGFQVGSDDNVNKNGKTIHYIAWKAVAQRMAVGSYTGNGADNRSITGVGFQPKYVIVQASGADGYQKPDSTGASTDASIKFKAQTVETDRIQALEADGFQVGKNTAVNANGTTYYYMAFDTYTNSSPTVDATGIYETNHSTPVTAMTPQTEYAAKVTVSDADTISDLSTVKVTIFFDSDGDNDPADVPASGNTQTAAILTCNVGATPSWQIDPSTATTWVLVSANCVQPNLSGTTGDFWFHFKPGKVATEALDWDAYATANDSGEAAGSRYDSSGYDMNWYGEVAVNTVTINWGPLPPGTDFGDPSKQTGISVTYIANGPYDTQIAADGTWTAAPSGSATLNSGGAPSANQFSMKADDTATLDNAVLVAASPAYVTIYDAGTQTTESGNIVTTNTIWLKLGTPFAGATYSGNVYFKITDGS